jgi:hypothetical protein
MERATAERPRNMISTGLVLRLLKETHENSKRYGRTRKCKTEDLS